MATNILVVEDDPDVRAALRDLLEDEGHQVRCASNGLIALDLVAAAAPDLVITDQQMPGMDGATLARELRMRGHGMPLLMVSAALRVTPPWGMPFLAKPFDSDVLLATVARLLIQYRATSGGYAGR